MLTSISAIQPPIEVISPLSRKQVRLIEATVDLRSVSFIDEKSGKFSITPLLIVLNQHVLDLNRGNKLRAARQLSISRSTLYRILGNESFLTH
jgi:DNA-binding NtrC family response regulator